MRCETLFLFHPRKEVVGCRWVYNVKLNLDGSLDRLKVQLVAKWYSQVYSVDYQDMFSPTAKIASGKEKTYGGICIWNCITGDDAQGIADPEEYLLQHFQTKDLWFLWYFLDIEVTGLKKKNLSVSKKRCAWYIV